VRAALPLLGLWMLGTSADALALRCDPPPRRSTFESPSGEYRLVVIRGQRLDGFDKRYADATLRLVRGPAGSDVVWEITAREQPLGALVTRDGNRVVAFDDWCSPFGPVLTIRGERGAVIRSLVDADIESVWEGLHDAMWRVKGIGPDGQTVVLYGDYAPHGSSRVALRRTVALTRGDVVEGPPEPDGFEVPTLLCPEGTALRRFASAAGPFALAPTLILACQRGEEHEPVRARAFSFENGIFLLEWDRRDGRDWNRAGPDAEHPGPCERVSRSAEEVSERCGPDVVPPDGAVPPTSSPSSSSPTSPSSPTSSPSPPPSSSPASSSP
jgi:hypothetical protein